MILTGKQILKEMGKGEIAIHPFNEKNLGANSYDVTLCSKLKVYDVPGINSPGYTGFLDMKKENKIKELEISEKGFVLHPNVLYIGCTNETATSKKFAPFFEGRSSIGRLGISTHITAGFGDIGWGYKEENGELVCKNPTWTLEITVVHPVMIYPNIRIGQAYFFVPHGELTFYKGKYSEQVEPQSSMMHKDFEDGNISEKGSGEVS